MAAVVKVWNSLREPVTHELSEEIVRGQSLYVVEVSKDVCSCNR